MRKLITILIILISLFGCEKEEEHCYYCEFNTSNGYGNSDTCGIPLDELKEDLRNRVGAYDFECNN